MPTVIEDLSEGLRSRVADEAGNTLTRVFQFKDLTGNGIDRFLSAWNLLGTTMTGDSGIVTIPRANEGIIFAGRTVFAKEFDLEPWPPSDAVLTVGYREDNTDLSGIDGVEIETGTTYEQDETDFDAENIVKPFSSRVPMYLLYNPDIQGATVDSAEFRKAVRLPMLTGKSFKRFTKTLGEDPSALSERFCSPPKTNRTLWKNYPPETALCLSIVGRNAGQGWRTTFDFAIDRIGKFRQIGRVRDETTGQLIPLSQQNVAGRNGIDEFIVQPQDNFSALPI